MICTIAIDSRLLWAVQIEDAEGEVHNYAVKPAPAGLDEWAVNMERFDSREEYRVAVNATGAWRCSCPDALYRARKEKRLCKHARAARGIRRLLDDLTRVPQPHENHERVEQLHADRPAAPATEPCEAGRA